jgi:CubicO group peptidase (beta-lactamase class C family)
VETVPAPIRSKIVLKALQKSIQSLLEQFVSEDSERGLQVAVYHRGELVANCAAGTTDAAGRQRVNDKTLFPVFSTTKGIAATLIHLLVERGKIAYDTPIADVWPEFAAHGKGTITLRHALNHTSGIPNMPLGIGHAELCDWDKMCAAIADLTPIAPPGREAVYHAITYGWILGETARRVDGRTFGELLRDEICLPLAVVDELFVGAPDDVAPRVAVLEAKVNEDELARIRADTSPQSIPALVQPLHVWMNRADARRACIPASNGIMTAHAIAKHYAALLPGGVDGVELLSPHQIALATEPQWPDNTPKDGPPSKHRLGYGMDISFSPAAFGHGGAGGSLGFADPASGITFGFTRNRFDSDITLPRILELLRSATS